MNLFNSEEIMTADAEIVKMGYPSLVLMENAGNAFMGAAREMLGVISGKAILVCCGPGKNGADGMVIARKMVAEGATVTVVLTQAPTEYEQESAKQLTMLHAMLHDSTKNRIIILCDSTETDLAASHFDLVVDALFGIGLSRPPVDRIAKLIDWINDSSLLVGSVDIPSGVSVDGSFFASAIKADFTVVFGVVKVVYGLNGYTHFGKVYFSALSAPYSLFSSSLTLNFPDALPSRSLTGHKGSFGQALFVGGAANYYGAPYFNAMSFLLAGGGYARLAVPCSLCPTIAALGPEIVLFPLRESSDGSIQSSAFLQIVPLFSSQDIVIIGSGLSRKASAAEFFLSVLDNLNQTTLIDGDGLYILGQSCNYLRMPRAHSLILTPHVAEMAHLTGLTVDQIKQDPIGIVQKYCQEWNAIIVLKDARTVIGFTNGRIWCNTSGNDGLATPGSGDVLAGMISALACQPGVSLIDSVRTAVFLHGLAADIAVETVGKDSLTATKLMEYIPSALKTFRESHYMYQNYRINILP